MLFAYFGPDTVLPLASTFAAVLGVLMMFGRHAVRFPLFLGRRAVGAVRRSGLFGRSAGANLRYDGPTRVRRRHAANAARESERVRP